MSRQRMSGCEVRDWSIGRRCVWAWPDGLAGATCARHLGWGLAVGGWQCPCCQLSRCESSRLALCSQNGAGGALKQWGKARAAVCGLQPPNVQRGGAPTAGAWQCRTNRASACSGELDTHIANDDTARWHHALLGKESGSGSWERWPRATSPGQYAAAAAAGGPRRACQPMLKDRLALDHRAGVGPCARRCYNNVCRPLVHRPVPTNPSTAHLTDW